MSTPQNDLSKLAFSSMCLPGSVAEQKEKERMEECQRTKALLKAKEERERPENLLQRQQKQLAADEAYKQRMHKGKSAFVSRRGCPRP